MNDKPKQASEMGEDDSIVIEGSATEIPTTVGDRADSDNGAGERKPGGLVAIRPPAGREVLMPLEADQVVEGMRRYQRLLRDLLEPSDWQTRDKHGNALERPFLKKCGWRKIARAFNLSFERISGAVERDQEGNPLRAEVWIRAVAPNGQYGDGDGYCSLDEGRFNSARGRAKLENDLRATATTRAKNRAVADLVGMGEVSAEEIDPAGEGDEAAVRAGRPASDELGRLAAGALRTLVGDQAPEAGRRIVADYGHLTAAAGRALCHAAALVAPLANERVEADASGDARTGGGQPVAVPDGGDVDYWQRKGRYPDAIVRSLATLACGEGDLGRLTPEQLHDLAFLVECAVRGKLSARTLEAWLERLAEREDRAAAAEALRTRLREQANEVELLGRREAA